MKKTSILLFLSPGIALAEPGADGAHIPLLWVFALLLCGGVAWMLGKWIAKLAEVRNPRYRWSITVIFVVTFALLIAPFIVIFGAILVTGRTM